MKTALYIVGALVLAFSLINTLGAGVITSSGFVCGTILICTAAILGAIQRRER